MKKRLLTMLLATMVLMGLSACGNEVPTSSTPSSMEDETTPSIEEEEPTPSNASTIDESIVDETIEDIPNEEDSPSINTWNTDIDNGTRWEYGEDAWLETYPLLEDTTLARNLTYFKNANNDSISITWVGPNGMGSQGGISPKGGTLTISDDNENYCLYIWGVSKLSSENGSIKNFDVDTIVGVWTGDCVVDTFKVVEDNDIIYSVMFEISEDYNGVSYKGYAYFVDYFDRMEEGLFAYLIEESLFNEDDAMMVINSIEYFEGLE